MPKEPDYEKEIRKRITRRYDNRKEFFGHLAAFLAFNGLMWGYFHPTDAGYTIAIIITGLWGMGILIHAVQYITTEASERAIEKAIERERQYRAGYYVPEPEMKRKRQRLSDLADDGELIEVVEDDQEDRYQSR